VTAANQRAVDRCTLTIDGSPVPPPLFAPPRSSHLRPGRSFLRSLPSCPVPTPDSMRVRVAPWLAELEAAEAAGERLRDESVGLYAVDLDGTTHGYGVSVRDDLLARGLLYQNADGAWHLRTHGFPDLRPGRRSA
jgi:hypothetical protein